MYKCKRNKNPTVFQNIFTHRTKTKYALQNENSIQEFSLKAFKCELKRISLSIELKDLEIL